MHMLSSYHISIWIDTAHQNDKNTYILLVFVGRPKYWDKPALGTCLSKRLGHARFRAFKILGTGPLLGHALLNSWDMPAPGACPLKFLGQARFWDRPFKILGTAPLLGHAL